MKVYIFAVIIAVTFPALSNATEAPPPSKAIKYFYRLANMTPRPPVVLACNGQYSSCTQDSDCCAGYVCISKKCE
jgi:Dickkopf N-terminal cysteine-rich region/Ion channel inhibitory toxin